MMWTDSSCLQENGCLFNGLSPNKIAYLTRVLGMERWTRAKERAAELIARIQPDQPSWENRNSSASYVQHLTTESIPCVVLVYGSLPLKKYLSDGDINFTVFIEDGNLKDYCSAKVNKIPEKEGTDANAEYQIKEVQLIPAEIIYRSEPIGRFGQKNKNQKPKTKNRIWLESKKQATQI